MSSSVNKNFGSTQNNNQGGTQYNFDRGKFTANVGPVTVNVNTPSESVLEKLTPHVATNALHNAKARANRRACLEGTRGGFIEELGKWIEDPEGNGQVFWVKAGAGVGKTAVAQTLCEKYSESLLAAAHFFSRNDTSRNSMNHFVPTIAYQLASLHLQLADAINTAIRSNPSFMGADWEVQFERLICKPCSQVDSQIWKTLPRLILIDGLDECMDIGEPQTTDQRRSTWERDGQRRLLSIIQNSLTAPSPLPLRFLIFSRPEHTISNLLHTDSFPDLEEMDMRELRAEADSDIYLYLCQEFARLVKERRDAGLDVSWPGEEAIQQLTRMSDGHFIYVVTVVKYVMDPNSLSPPQERLDIILRPKASKYPDLRPLDQLYLQILQPFVDIRQQLLLPLLNLIIAPPLRTHVTIGVPYKIPGGTCRSRRVLAELLNQPNSRISIILSRLRSVLYVPGDECSEAVSVLHASFSDFLGDQRRSHNFHVECIDEGSYRDKLFQSSLRVLKRIMLRYRNNQEGIGLQEPPVIEAWAFDAWRSLLAGIYNGFRASGLGTESVDEFDVYCYVNMLNDRNYIRPLISFYGAAWNTLIAANALHLSQVYCASLTGDVTDVGMNFNIRESRHKNQPFFRFFNEDWVAALPKQHWEVCYLQLKLLVGCLWDPRESYRDPTSYCGSKLPLHDGNDSGTFLKIFPHDIPPSTLAQSVAIGDCQFWRFGRGPWGAFKFRQLAIAPTASGDLGWDTLPFTSSDLYDWMVGFARKQMKRAKKERAKKRQEAMREESEVMREQAMEDQEAARQHGQRVAMREEFEEVTREQLKKEQEAARQNGWRVAVFFRRLLRLNPQSEEEEREREMREREREEREREWQEEERVWEEREREREEREREQREKEREWEADKKEWKEFLAEEGQYHGEAW
ncbi:hypothetical protein V5O48_006645 [Marasmius crinis-equi]|uniref:Nephrocystin 3-like N-terminal domain-containing protein n=1 Tax=Marasmius crinis-equi TaxID=585013 RepID=A0ABR3FIY4_9AGAR